METTEVKLHSEFGPSSLERRMLCPGSALQERDMPDSPNKYSEQGTNLHEVMRIYCEALLSKNDAALNKKYSESRKALTAEELDMIYRCENQVLNALKKFKTPPMMLVEKYVDCKVIGEGIFGTPDLVLYSPFEHAYIPDWKFGYGKVTEATHNLQLRAYAMAIMDKYDLQSCEVCIFAPLRDWKTERTYHQEDWQANVDDLRNIVALAQAENAPLNPGERQCKYCKAISKCPAVLKDVSHIATQPPVNTLANFELGELLMFAERVEAWISAAKGAAYAALISGKEVPGWHLVETLKTREWIDEKSASKKLAALAKKLKKKPIELVTIPELKSPAQIEKVLGKSVAVSDVIGPLTKREPGAKKMERVEK